ncbi:hypothetical protein EZV73_21035 [Acidaminobacter sp. JC074]|uniref:hypothetical protein n=1 Tax=Acidaminobacter sp. JC074 TaxID=2530199 RepID=UPI001F1074C1|nr:hypothetical protein [Acidaminobacter sp. JC074]MCH4890078.1 hypothetical protein [Acidaminobacter sp. JC074]
MSNVIKLRYTDKGIGVNFYNSKEEKHYKEIIETIKPQVSSKVSLGISDVKWDLDNMTLGHSDKAANKLLKKVALKLVS